MCDNLNTPLYRAFPPTKARCLARRVRLVFTSQHGRWLYRAEPELRVLTRQALAPRMATQAAVHAQVAAWTEDRNTAQTGIDWPFRTVDARLRLKTLKYDSVPGASACAIATALPRKDGRALHGPCICRNT